MKLTKTILSAAALVALAAGCNKAEQNAAPEAKTGRVVTLSASIVADEETKAYIENETGVFTWAAGDRIAVYTSDGKFTAFSIDNECAGKTTGVFSATLDDGVEIVGPALFPYSDAHALNTDGTISFNMPAQRDWYNRAVQCPMAAVWDGNGPINFKHIGGVIRIPFDDLSTTSQEFTFTSNDSRITGLFTLDLTASAPQITAEATGTASTFTVKFTEPGIPALHRDFYIPVPVGNYTNVTVKNQRTGGYVRSSFTSTTAKINVTRGAIINMPVLSGQTLLNNFEDGVTPSNFTTTNKNFGTDGDALYVKENPFKDAVNPSNYVLAMEMDNSATETSGFFNISATNSIYGNNHRNNAVSFRIKIHFATPEDAAVYYPNVNFNNKGRVLPTRINGQDFDPQTAEKWAEIVDPNGWNYFEYTNSDIVNNGGSYQIRNFVTITDGTTTTEGSRKLYFDDFAYVK